MVFTLLKGYKKEEEEEYVAETDVVCKIKIFTFWTYLDKAC